MRASVDLEGARCGARTRNGYRACTGAAPIPFPVPRRSGQRRAGPRSPPLDFEPLDQSSNSVEIRNTTMLPAKVPSNGRRSDQVVVAPVTAPAVVSTAVIPMALQKKPPQVLSPIPDTGALLASLHRRWLLALVLGL